MREEAGEDSQKGEEHPVVQPLLQILLLVDILAEEEHGRDDNHDGSKHSARDDEDQQRKKRGENHEKVVSRNVHRRLDLRDQLYS